MAQTQTSCHRATTIRYYYTTTTSSCHLDLLDRPHCSFEIANRHWRNNINNSSAIEVKIKISISMSRCTGGEETMHDDTNEEVDNDEGVDYEGNSDDVDYADDNGNEEVDNDDDADYEGNSDVEFDIDSQNNQ